MLIVMVMVPDGDGDVGDDGGGDVPRKLVWYIVYGDAMVVFLCGTPIWRRS